MYHSSKEADFFSILFGTFYENTRPILFLQSDLEQIWSLSLKRKKGVNFSITETNVNKEEKVDAVRRLFAEEPGRSIRNASSASGLSYHLVRDILHKELYFKPWKPKSVQELFLEDMDRRLEFTETMLELAERRHDLFSKVV